ncbi:MAG: Flavoprotein [Ignavibacteria bacterium]|nr:Flavoprotein [Ignavibacteria bacterium]
MFSFEPKDQPQQVVQSFLVGGVAPRPIALVSTISKDRIPNLSPFSFFNAFGSNPPVVAFSASRRGRDGSLKDTYNNLIDTGECVINAVTFNILEQINLASTEYASEVNEWEKSGLTPIKSDIINPCLVQESPFRMECKLYQMVSVGINPGSANIAICEVLKFHVDEEIMENGKINPFKIHHIGRNGGDIWSNIDSNALFQLKKPTTNNNIGMNGLPDYIRNSPVFTANNLARLALLETTPDLERAYEFIKGYEPLKSSLSDFEQFRISGDLGKMLSSALFNISNLENILELTAKEFLQQNRIKEAFLICMYNNHIMKD